jgi:hypothetical protein
MFDGFLRREIIGDFKIAVVVKTLQSNKINKLKCKESSEIMKTQRVHASMLKLLM